MDQQRVHHEYHGFGTPHLTRHNGFEVFVLFEKGQKVWVRADSLRPATTVNEGDLPPTPSLPDGSQTPGAKIRSDGTASFRDRAWIRALKRAGSGDEECRRVRYSQDRSRRARMPGNRRVDQTRPDDDGQFRSRRMVEALRLGIVPRDCAADFTFGRDVETAAIQSWLAGPNGVLKLVGDYGAGKTHLLDYMSGMALSAGYAVARVQINPGEAPFSKPKRVYGQLMASLRYVSPRSEEEGEFVSLLQEILDQGALQDHSFFKHLADNDDVDMWEWISGREPKPYPPDRKGQSPYNWYLPGMYDFGTAPNIYTYLLSGIARAAVDAVGLKGLLLLFDESESIGQYGYPYELIKSNSFIRALSRTANNNRALSRFPEDDVDLDFCRMGKQIHPYIYRTPTRMKIVFAVTPYESEYFLAGERGIEPLHLSELESMPRGQVRKAVRRIYDRAYGTDVGRRALDSGNPETNDAKQTRMFIKGCIEALDLARNGDGHE